MNEDVSDSARSVDQFVDAQNISLVQVFSSFQLFDDKKNSDNCRYL